jgi:hypothetical protein
MNYQIKIEQPDGKLVYHGTLDVLSYWDIVRALKGGDIDADSPFFVDHPVEDHPYMVYINHDNNKVDKK